MTNENEVQSLLNRNADNRLSYLLEKVKETKEIWILTDDLGAVMFQSEEEDCIPVWPSKEVAQHWCDGDWEHCRPHAIELAAWQDRWTPGLEDDDVCVLIFPDDNDEGIVMLPWEFQEKLEG
ncbi:MAG: DUF2750 domain-containing protein [Aestuariibacter sp.]